MYLSKKIFTIYCSMCSYGSIHICYVKYGTDKSVVKNSFFYFSTKTYAVGSFEHPKQMLKPLYRKYSQFYTPKLCYSGSMESTLTSGLFLFVAPSNER